MFIDLIIEAIYTNQKIKGGWNSSDNSFKTHDNVVIIDCVIPSSGYYKFRFRSTSLVDENVHMNFFYSWYAE